MLTAASHDATTVWDWLNANAGAVSAVATVLTALVAMAALGSAARDSRARTRPYIVVELQRAPHTFIAIDVAIRNYGSAPAIDVAVSFDPALPREPDTRPNTTAEFFSTPIPTLGPGQHFTTVWQSWVKGTKDWDGPRTTATVEYRWGRRRYRDRYVLDADSYDDATMVVSGDSALGSLRKIADATATIAKRSSGRR